MVGGWCCVMFVMACECKLYSFSPTVRPSRETSHLSDMSFRRDAGTRGLSRRGELTGCLAPILLVRCWCWTAMGSTRLGCRCTYTPGLNLFGGSWTGLDLFDARTCFWKRVWGEARFCAVRRAATGSCPVLSTTGLLHRAMRFSPSRLLSWVSRYRIPKSRCRMRFMRVEEPMGKLVL
jgi:hypothetical protein